MAEEEELEAHVRWWDGRNGWHVEETRWEVGDSQWDHGR